MSRSGPVIPALEERPVRFDYSYRMHCACGGVSTLSAADYHTEQSVAALMPCEHCESSIHFGPAVAALRDPADSALDDVRINHLAWYHTSTSPNWPSSDYAVAEEARLRAAKERFSGLPLQSLLDRQLSQALHVGAYEAAVENMLRRMRYQNDGNERFYLYRVALAVNPARVESGYRDENHDAAAQLSAAELRASGLDAVRYLNVHEAVGSISLAVPPETIAWVQCVALPANGLAAAHDASLLSVLDGCQDQLDRLARTAPDTTGIAPYRLRMMQLRPAADPTGIGAASARHERELRDVWASAVASLTERYLAGISPVVGDDFEGAVDAWHRAQEPMTIRSHADFFAATASALTRPEAMIALLSEQQPRAMINSAFPR